MARPGSEASSSCRGNGPWEGRDSASRDAIQLADDILVLLGDDRAGSSNDGYPDEPDDTDNEGRTEDDNLLPNRRHLDADGPGVHEAGGQDLGVSEPSPEDGVAGSAGLESDTQRGGNDQASLGNGVEPQSHTGSEGSGEEISPLTLRHQIPLALAPEPLNIQQSTFSQPERFRLPRIPRLSPRPSAALSSPGAPSSGTASLLSCGSPHTWVDAMFGGGRDSWTGTPLRTTPPQTVDYPLDIECTDSSLSRASSTSSAVSSVLPFGRLSTINVYPQTVFPTDADSIKASYHSELTSTKTALEIPYAFSHLEGFYWTRNDALLDRKWNMWATPPCLNCTVLDLANANVGVKQPRYFFSSRCNRWEVQNNSDGAVRSCSRCKASGQWDSCVETIEVRGDGVVGDTFIRPKKQQRWRHGEDDSIWVDPFQEAIWSREEMDLRAEGQVVWRPINLERDNRVAKATLLDLWIELGGSDELQVKVEGSAQRRVQIEKGVCQVVEWDEEDLVNLPLQLEVPLQHEDRRRREMEQAQRQQQESSEEDDAKLEPV